MENTPASVAWNAKGNSNRPYRALSAVRQLDQPCFAVEHFGTMPTVVQYKVTADFTRAMPRQPRVVYLQP